MYLLLPLTIVVVNSMGKVENLMGFVSIDEMVLSFQVNGRVAAMVHVYFLENYALDLVHEHPVKHSIT